MADHLVALTGATLAPEQRASLAALALATAFAAPGKHDTAALERDLLAHFAGTDSLNHLDATTLLAYLHGLDAVALDLADLVAQFDTNPAALHTALQQHNEAGGLVLLCVAKPELLSDADTSALLHPSAQGPLWLLRSGYSDDPPYGYYYDLAASGPQPARILWPVVAGAQITAAIALDAPTPPVDMAALLSTLQGVGDAILQATTALGTANAALSAASSAHQTILASLGKGAGQSI